MGKLEKYTSYKESGVEWLGEIPEHWEILKTKYFHQNLKVLNTKRVCDNVLSLTLRGVVNNNIDSPEGLVPKDYATYQIFEKDDLVFKLIDLENISTSRVGVVHEKGIMSSAYIRLQIGQTSIPRFAYYYYYSLYINQVYNNIGSGVRSTLNPTDLLNIEYIEPKIDEQLKIIEYLDEKIAQIDELISQKQKLIELLKERKQIVINDAVTKGLDKNVEFVDSGVEWLGEIPEHWEIKELKYALKFTTGGTPSSGVENYYNGEEPWVTIADMTGRYIEKSHFISKKAVRECNMQIVPKNSLLYSFKLSVGQVAFTKEEIYTNEAIASFYPSKNIDLNFWYYVLPIFLIKNANTNIYGAFLLNQDLIKNALIIFPPKEEQTKIASFLDEKTAKIDTAIELQQNYIDKLKEYKASLIDSV
ncbi:MAG: restriction endonuclease subunit S, partial [Campylobacterales bacterium]|nr:restriction endonuclease subunit S [Campylobacterales bacterium]